MPNQPTVVKVAPTDRGCCIRVEGCGTMNESQAAQDLAARTLLSGPDAVVVFDLGDCEYLDSTFIGCLLQLHRNFGKGKPPRFTLAASAAKRKKLLGACALDRVLPAVDTPPAVLGQWIGITVGKDRTQLMRHVMECHRALAEVDCPMKGAFAKIADGIERDLARTTAPVPGAVITSHSAPAVSAQ
jgi:anti-anti-sigma regulatory factor